jgi:hypothetical protein
MSITVAQDINLPSGDNDCGVWLMPNVDTAESPYTRLGQSYEKGYVAGSADCPCVRTWASVLLRPMSGSVFSSPPSSRAVQ